MMFLIFFTMTLLENVSAREAGIEDRLESLGNQHVYEMDFSENFQDQEMAKTLFDKAGSEHKIDSDYIWKVSNEKALLNPLVVAYRYEGRAVNPTWICYQMKGIDESLSQHLWTSGLLGNSFPIPPKHFCEGQIPFENNGQTYMISVNTSSWRSMLDILEAQLRQVSRDSVPEFVLHDENVLLEYQVSRMPDLKCRRLEAIHSKGVRYEEANLRLWRHNVLPSKNPWEYKLLQRLTVVRCQIEIKQPVGMTGGSF